MRKKVVLRSQNAVLPKMAIFELKNDY
jgi:hypothetical protein